MRRRASTLALCGLLLVGACGGSGGADGERLEIYHLEEAIGPPGEAGELRCGPPRSCPGVVEQPAPREVRYVVRGDPGVTDAGLDRSTARSAGTAVSVAFTASGSDAFARLTREVARVGGRDQGWHHVAIVVGDEIVAFPEIDFDAYPDGIAGAPGIELSAVSAEDARRLVRRLRGD